MGKRETAPSESEWQILEVLWERNAPMTSLEVIHELQRHTDMTPRMVRVLMNRLCQKGLLSYVIDEHDARVYIYSVLKTKEECLAEKSRRFADSYFSGNFASAAAAFLRNADLTEGQMKELEEILDRRRGENDSWQDS